MVGILHDYGVILQDHRWYPTRPLGYSTGQSPWGRGGYHPRPWGITQNNGGNQQKHHDEGESSAPTTIFNTDTRVASPHTTSRQGHESGMIVISGPQTRHFNDSRNGLKRGVKCLYPNKFWPYFMKISFIEHQKSGQVTLKMLFKILIHIKRPILYMSHISGCHYSGPTEIYISAKFHLDWSQHERTAAQNMVCRFDLWPHTTPEMSMSKKKNKCQRRKINEVKICTKLTAECCRTGTVLLALFTLPGKMPSPCVVRGHTWNLVPDTYLKSDENLSHSIRSAVGS